MKTSNKHPNQVRTSPHYPPSQTLTFLTRTVGETPPPHKSEAQSPHKPIAKVSRLQQSHPRLPVVSIRWQRPTPRRQLGRQSRREFRKCFRPTRSLGVAEMAGGKTERRAVEAGKLKSLAFLCVVNCAGVIFGSRFRVGGKGEG